MKEGSKEWVEEYQQGFNRGYMLTEYAPELSYDIAKSLEESKASSPHAEGFIDGRAEYRLEQIRELRPEWLRAHEPDNTPKPQQPDKEPNKNIDHDR